MTLFRRSRDKDGDGTALESVVLELVDILNEEPELGEQETVEALMGRGVPELTAMRVVIFTPVAFGRIVLQRAGLTTFTADYHVRGARSSTTKPLRLADTPEFVAAHAVANRVDWAGAGPQALASRSAEFNAANNLLWAGESLADVGATSLVIAWDIL